ncbi:HAD-IA family hydrolase [bacterium]|nr:MAG: HAD-IA family hydrolase [bacterium]
MTDIDLLIFDLDGTLVDSLDDIVSSVNHTLPQLGLDILSRDEIQSYVGDGIKMLLIRAVGTQADVSDDLVERARKIYYEHHEQHCLDHVHMYPNALEVMEHFRSKKKAVVSNKSERFTKKILEGLGLASYLDLIIGGDSLSSKKPDPLVIEHTVSLLKVEKRKTVMIGDGHQDIQCGKSAGVITCGVTYGFKPVEDTKDADFSINDLMELKNIFR